MKKINLMLFVIFSVLIVSCKLSLVSKIRVKAKPEVTVHAGENEIKLDEYVSAKRFIGQINDPTYKVFNFINDKDDISAVLIHYPITGLALDMTKNFKVLDEIQTGASESLKEQSFMFNNPEKQRKEIDLDIIQKKLADTFTKSQTILASKPDASDVSFPEQTVPLTVPFNKAVFGENTVLRISAETNAAGIEVKITEVKVPLYLSGEATYTGNGNTASVDLSNKAVGNTTNIKIKFTITGSANPSFNITLKAKLDGIIKEAEGITLTSVSFPVNTIEIPIPSDNFEEAKIDIGTITATKPIPQGWSGFSCDYTGVTVSQPGGLNLHLAGDDTDLNDKTINKNNITISGTFSITANNATYKYAKTGNMEFGVAIQKFNYVKIKMPDSFNPKVEKTIPTPADLKKWVSKVHFEKLTVSINLKNGLPTGNNIEIEAVSTAFGLNGTKTFPSGGESAVSQTETIEHCNFDFIPNTQPNTDLKITVTPPGYSEGTKIMQVRNVEAGKKISFGGEITIENKWEYAVVKPNSGGGFTGLYPAAANEYVNLGQFIELQEKGLKLNTVTANFYVHSDFLKTKSAQPKGKLYLNYKKGSSPEKEYILGSDTADENINFAPPLPSFFYIGKNGDEYKGTIPEPSAKKNIAPILNEDGSELKFHYAIKLDEITIYKTEVDSFSTEGKTAKITGDILLYVPASFTVNNDIKLYTMQGKGDLFRRTGTNNNDYTQKLFKSLKEITLKLGYENNIGPRIKAELINKNADGEVKFKRIVDLQQDKSSIDIQINSDEFAYIKNTVPFTVDINIVVPKGSASIKRNARVKIMPFVNAKIELDETINLK